MSERQKRLLAYVFIFVVCVSYFGCGYYFGVTRPARLHQRAALACPADGHRWSAEQPGTKPH
jgi:hypothetical protein